MLETSCSSSRECLGLAAILAGSATGGQNKLEYIFASITSLPTFINFGFVPLSAIVKSYWSTHLLQSARVPSLHLQIDLRFAPSAQQDSVLMEF